ncbi:PilW family protein [Uliginosibacterium sp. sgz301328]|uniref:PilW family protein n=1 Tax=Uliginosibacterium sp. sgz301328 TaxID=3243764 RepID=UPI00359E4C6D
MRRTRSTQRGISLVEVMVGITVALLASLVVINAFSGSEAYKRNTTGASDAQQTAGMLGAYLSQAFQESGSALVRGEGIVGCALQLTVGVDAKWPRTAPFDAPFDHVPATLRVAPAIAIASTNAEGSADSDTLVLMTGKPTASPQDYPAVFNTKLTLSPTPAILFNASDYLLAFSDPTLPSGTSAVTDVADCQMLRVASNFAPSTLGTFSDAWGGKPIGAGKQVVELNADYGTPDAVSTGSNFLIRNLGAAPSFVALTRGDNASLQQVNLLDGNVQTVAENVYAIKVMYGIDSDSDGVIASGDWVAPTGTWAAGTLLDGTRAQAANVNKIRAVRIGIVVRSSQMVTQDAATATVTLFPDLGDSKKITYSFSGAEARYQYQVYDMTVALQNPRGL